MQENSYEEVEKKTKREKKVQKKKINLPTYLPNVITTTSSAYCSLA